MPSAPPDSGTLPEDMACEADGSVTASKVAAITIKIEPELYDRLRLTAMSRDTTTQRLVLEAVEQFLNVHWPA